MQRIASTNEQFRSTDWDIINKLKIGTHIQVHISNLINPHVHRRVRDLDHSHIDRLKMAFKTSYRAEFNCMVGMVVNKPPTLDEFAFPGSSTVEVLGGNHSRVALQELNLQQCVTMVLYENLSDAQALTIGLEHNRTNENAKLMNFEDDVLLFRNVLESKRKENSEKTKRQISIIWRSDLCGITQRNKVELRNSYKIHMHLASLQKDEWNALINVFDAFRKKTIKGLKKVDNVTQYMFRMFIRLPSDSVKRNLLLELGSGEITPHEFRMKIKRIVDQKQIDLAETEDIAKDNEMELSTEDSLSANDQRYTEEEAYNFVDTQQEQTSHRTKMDNHEQLEEDMKYITYSLKREKELRKMAFVTIEAKETLIKEKDKKILELEDRDKLQQKTNKEYMIKQNLELEKYKLQIRQLTMKTDLLQKELEREKIRCKAAEETAARARAQFLKNTNNDNILISKRKTDMTSEKENGKKPKQRKTVPIVKSMEIRIEKLDAANQQNYEEKQEKMSEGEDKRDANHNHNSKERKEILLEKDEQIDANPKHNSEEKKGILLGRADKERCTIALVEYNRGKVYYVMLTDEDNIAYCHKPVGQIKDGVFIQHPTAASFIVNHKDVQQFEEKFIICRFSCVSDGTHISVENMSLKMTDQLSDIQTYINKLNALS